MVNEHAIFVYGTLKRGRTNSHYLNSADFVGEFITKCATYDLLTLNIPFLYKSEPGFHVQGEVYLVNNETLSYLDVLENNGTLYTRELLEVCELNASAWCYFLTSSSIEVNDTNKNYSFLDDERRIISW